MAKKPTSKDISESFVDERRKAAYLSALKVQFNLRRWILDQKRRWMYFGEVRSQRLMDGTNCSMEVKIMSGHSRN